MVLSEENRFIALGDGGSGLPAQRKIAEQMLRCHDQSAYNLVLLLGDNIYPNGDTIKYGENRFTTLYKPLLERNVRFMPVLGNHDISGPLGVGYPTLWMSNQRENMRFFRMPASHYDFTMGPFHFFMLNTNRFDRLQADWLGQALADSTGAWKIVCGHHPVFSSGFHGSKISLRRKLKPILERRGANLYLSAHEHDYERFASINDVTYIVSGGGGAELRVFRKPLAGSLVRHSQHHFLVCELREHDSDKPHLEVTAINDSGEHIDRFMLRPPEAYQGRAYHLATGGTLAKTKPQS